MKIGDRVIVKSKYIMEYGETDFVGVIIDLVPNANMVSVEFDKHIDGHSCRGRGKDGHCWNIDYENIIIEGDISNFKKELNDIIL